METDKFKNMIMLKNLPSNIIEEAIVIFKEPQTIKQKECIEKGNKVNIDDIQPKSKQYILNEAEMLIANYIRKVEDTKKNKNDEIGLKSKYRKIKKYNIILLVMLIISLIINFI